MCRADVHGHVYTRAGLSHTASSLPKAPKCSKWLLVLTDWLETAFLLVDNVHSNIYFASEGIFNPHVLLTKIQNIARGKARMDLNHAWLGNRYDICQHHDMTYVSCYGLNTVFSCFLLYFCSGLYSFTADTDYKDTYVHIYKQTQSWQLLVLWWQWTTTLPFEQHEEGVMYMPQRSDKRTELLWAKNDVIHIKSK